MKKNEQLNISNSALFNVEVIQKNDKYNDSIISNVYKDFESLKKLINLLKPKFHIICSITICSQETNYKKIVDRKCIAVGDTIEKCYEAIFIKKNGWKYCNDINIDIDSKVFQGEYHNYFYGEDGVGSYAKCGGDMW